jgi:hypothetical protein
VRLIRSLALAARRSRRRIGWSADERYRRQKR